MTHSDTSQNRESEDRDYDLRVREAALRLTLEHARGRTDVDINRCFAWFERLLRDGGR